MKYEFIKVSTPLNKLDILCKKNNCLFKVYHMCDELGRQFSYSCPNTTLFQQRMLICDHWYMVNCSKAEKDYSANLLIGLY